jgi:hypothetical protein
MLDVKAQLDNKTVVTALESQKIAQSLRGLKIDLPGLGEQQLQVVRPKVDIGENAIKIDALLITQGASEDTGVPLVISGTPVLKGDKVFISEMKVESPCITEPAQFATFFQDLFNPIFDFSRLDRKDHAFRLKQLAIKGDTIEGGGQLLLVPRNLAQAQPAQAPTVQPHPIEVQPAQAIPVQEQPVADKAPVKQPVFRTFITDHVSRDP